jgi:hypothetical protein
MEGNGSRSNEWLSYETNPAKTEPIEAGSEFKALPEGGSPSDPPATPSGVGFCRGR